MPWYRRTSALALVAFDWIIGLVWYSLKIIAAPIYLLTNDPGGDGWRASRDAADMRRRVHMARSLTGRREDGMICSGDLGAGRLMLVG